MAGGRLTHTPHCDQQEKAGIVDIGNSQISNFPFQQFWAVRNGHHLNTHVQYVIQHFLSVFHFFLIFFSILDVMKEKCNSSVDG